jgi:hypothetical protein
VEAKGDDKGFGGDEMTRAKKWLFGIVDSFRACVERMIQQKEKFAFRPENTVIALHQHRWHCSDFLAL